MCVLKLVLDRYTPSRALREQGLGETLSYASVDSELEEWNCEDADGDNANGANMDNDDANGDNTNSEDKDEEQDKEMVDSFVESVESEEEEQDLDEGTPRPMPMYVQHGNYGKE